MGRSRILLVINSESNDTRSKQKLKCDYLLLLGVAGQVKVEDHHEEVPRVQAFLIDRYLVATLAVFLPFRSFWRMIDSLSSTY